MPARLGSVVRRVMDNSTPVAIRRLVNESEQHDGRSVADNGRLRGWLHAWARRTLGCPRASPAGAPAWMIGLRHVGRMNLDPDQTSDRNPDRQAESVMTRR